MLVWENWETNWYVELIGLGYYASSINEIVLKSEYTSQICKTKIGVENGKGSDLTF